VTRTVAATVERWPLAAPFVIARGTKTEAVVVVATVADGRLTGRGECVPYARYGETPEATVAAILTVAAAIADAADAAAARDRLATVLPAGAARNALDAALWDLDARQRGTTVRDLLGLPPFTPTLTAYTLSLDTPDAMAAAARAVAGLPLLKLKLGGAGDDARLRAVRAARPDARLIADANEAWTDDLLVPLLAVAAEVGVEMVEQPLPAGRDAALAEIARPVPVCADESVHTRADLASLARRYDAVNVKLDKAGGVSEVIALATAARAAGLAVMVGSMVATSLAVAPALLLAGHARWLDLDGPLLLARDRTPALTIRDGVIAPPPPDLWGG
jgi:L-alanine-DL-glutamate epimerase-like enolase superfamily enzyme